MARFSPIRSSGVVLSLLIGFVLLGPRIQPSVASWPSTAAIDSDTAKDLDPKPYEAKVDCITPDGRLVPVARASKESASALASMTDASTLRCLLQEGDTTFIISFPKASLIDGFKFVNDNAGAQGDMRIAVSHYRLPANSSKWTEVSGKTEFISKRLFNLSMIGVEARYVKLSFHVEKGNQLASTSRLDGINP